MKNLYCLLSLLLFVGLAIPAYAQTNSENIIINEIDINPPGNDATSIIEWIELYNPTNSTVDLTGWQIASTTNMKKTMIISSDTIGPGEFLVYTYQSIWFTNANDSVELRDANQNLIDKTPLLADIRNDFFSWQRIYDGHDFDTFDDWKFALSTSNSSNGKLSQAQKSNILSITISSDKPSYVFGETAILQGSVSKEIHVEKPYFKPESIKLIISGPIYNNELTLYPDRDLNFGTTLALHEVLGIIEGLYTVDVSYAGSTENTSFSVGPKVIETTNETLSELKIITDKSQYIPGETVSITGFTTSVIPYEGMTFSVTDPLAKIISHGTLFPTDGKFKTNLFVTTIEPVYGNYVINAKYNEETVFNTFEVLEDVKENTPISLWANKTAYGLGETVEITGRINDVWISTLDLEIIQTKHSIIPDSRDSGFKILDGVQIAGDGTFSYSFDIPDSPVRYGDYKITVSKDIGTATLIISVVEDPSNYVATDDPITIQTDKPIYDIGDTMIVNGFVKTLIENSGYLIGTPVKISIFHEDGTSLKTVGLDSTRQTFRNNEFNIDYDFTITPQTSGSYSLSLDIAQNIFTAGNYVVKSEYQDYSAFFAFSVADSLNLEDGALISTDKNIYGLGEQVTLSGVIPPIYDQSINISLVKPDGTQINSAVTADNQKFSWSWTTPAVEKYQNTDKANPSNFGIYKIIVLTESFSENIFFKVSADPENDSFSEESIFVATDKSLYKVGEKLHVTGNVIISEQSGAGHVVPTRVAVVVLDGAFPYKQIHESKVYPKSGGEFSSTFELPATIFTKGQYTVKVNYESLSAESTFGVTSDFVFGTDVKLELLLSTDKSEYNLGDTVTVSGKPSKLIYLDNFDVRIIQQSENSITCGLVYCGDRIGSILSIFPSPSGSFTHELKISDSPSSIGSYEIIVDADFDTKSVLFDVVEKLQPKKLDTVIEKENRISDNIINIVTSEKTVDSNTIAPRVISGSLITPDKDDSSTVNLRISSESGVCIIGPDVDCLVDKSTRKPGGIYDVVTVDEMSLNVRYSGPDVRLERFSILPESPTVFLPNATWNVEIVKDEQISRFYYKITYKSLE